MATSEEIDAVYIATPFSFHAVQAVLCEYPLAANSTEVMKMIQATKYDNPLTLVPNLKVTTLTSIYR